MNVCFLTSGHDPFDDRIFYHMAKSLARRKHHIEIISSTASRNEVIDDIKLNCFDGSALHGIQKARQFIKRLNEFSPEAIICSEPLPLYAAHKYSTGQILKVRTIYDITEWYPSKKNICHYNLLIRWFFFIKLLAFNILVSRYADFFIFGEWYKSRPYRLLFPRKPFLFVSYYPNLEYINGTIPGLDTDKLRLSYSGKVSADKGYDNFIKVISQLSDLHENLKIEVKIIGWQDDCEKDSSSLKLPEKKNLSVTCYDRQPFIKYLELIRDTDIFIDLRKTDFENRHCLPIKLFYFAAYERPVICSDLKSIRKETDISNFGFLVNPVCTNKIVSLISSYIENRDLYLSHCHSARKSIEERYNWNSVESEFVRFITKA